MHKQDKLFENNMEMQNGLRTTEIRTTNRMMKPVAFMNPDGYDPIKFYGADGREKPFVIATPDNTTPYTIVGVQSKAKQTIILATNFN